MYVNRILVLLLVASFVFAPAIESWISAGGSSWYRPFLLWLLIIVMAYIAHYNRRGDDL